MKARCSGKQERYARNYLLRGISICDEWVNDFMSFYVWSIKNGYAPNLSIDRVDNTKGYSPDNCRWATPREQMNNVRYNVFMTMNGETHTISEWASITGLNQQMLYSRKEYGWPDEKALTTPSQRSCQILQLDLSGNIVAKYSSIKEASEITGISLANISSACSGRRLNAGGFKWKKENKNGLNKMNSDEM